MKKDTEQQYKEITVKEPRLTPEEKLYVKAYLRTRSHSEAHKLVKNIKNPKKDNPFSRSHAVQYHINKHMVNLIDAEGLNENDIINLLLQEATRLGAGSSPTARVQALSLLGKHLGLFEEKQKEDTKVQFNIVNYDSKIKIEQTKEIEDKNKDEEEPISLPNNIKIKAYK